MFLNMTNDRRKEIEKMMTEYNFRTTTIVKLLAQEIEELKKCDFNLVEICSILHIELGFDIKPNTLQKIINGTKIPENEDIESNIVETGKDKKVDGVVSGKSIPLVQDDTKNDFSFFEEE